MDLHRADVDDAPVVHAVLLAAFTPFRAHYTAGCFDATVLDAPRIRRRMQEGPVWLAMIDGQPVGTVSAMLDRRGAYVRGLAVLPAARRRGVGKALLDACADWGRRQGAPAMWLSTTLFLEASIALYEAYGFADASGPSDLEGTPLRSFEMPF